MNKETIENAADKYAESATPSNCYGDFDQNAIAEAFERGARWRINSVWHDTGEIPKEGEHIVIVMENRCFTSWFVTPDIAMMFKKFRAVLWAYSRDLLPEGNEGTK